MVFCQNTCHSSEHIRASWSVPAMFSAVYRHNAMSFKKICRNKVFSSRRKYFWKNKKPNIFDNSQSIPVFLKMFLSKRRMWEISSRERDYNCSFLVMSWRILLYSHPKPFVFAQYKSIPPNTKVPLWWPLAGTLQDARICSDEW